MSRARASVPVAGPNLVTDASPKHRALCLAHGLDPSQLAHMESGNLAARAISDGSSGTRLCGHVCIGTS